jgi:uncharacterized membrane protein YczE
VIKKFKKNFVFSIATVMIYGVFLDIWSKVLSCIPTETLLVRIILFLFGKVICSTSIAFFLHTYFPLEVYEVFVKEMAEKFKFNIGAVKVVFDCSCLVLAIVMSVVFFGELRGIGVGTLITAFTEGILVNKINKLYMTKFDFKDGLPLRKYFE